MRGRVSRQKTEVNVWISTVNNRHWALIPVEFIFVSLRVHQHFHRANASS